VAAPKREKQAKTDQREHERREKRDRAQDPDAPRSREAQSAASGALFNRAAIALVEFPFEHRLSPLTDGWRLEAASAGELTVHLVDGKERRFELAVGDHLSRSADELYLYVAPKAQKATKARARGR
jgi:hypothetical protein